MLTGLGVLRHVHDGCSHLRWTAGWHRLAPPRTAEAGERRAGARADLLGRGVVGYEVCQAVRGRPDLAGLKIVMLSAKGSEAEINKGLSLGADRYVTKPLSTQELLAAIDTLLQAGDTDRR